MNPSLFAQSGGLEARPVFLGLPEIRAVVQEKGLYPRDGKMIRADGHDLASVLNLQSMQQIEERINALAREMREAKAQFEETLEKTMEIASTSTDPYEIHYMTNMFMHHREVVRELAKNQRLSERTQLMLVTDRELQRDRQVQLALAHNPATTPAIMEKMMSYSRDTFVLNGIALNASQHSRASAVHTPYADICKQLSLIHSDIILSKAAIPGVKDPETLRQLADSHSRFLAGDKLELIAENPYTPDDVLERMSQAPLARVEHAFGVDVAGKARHALAVRRQRQHATEGPEFSA